jgi:hypothetical protein
VRRDDGARPFGDEPVELPLVEVQGVGANVCEDQRRTAQRKRVRTGDEREGRDDDLVSRPDVEQERRELQRVCARRGEKRARDAELFFEQRLALPRERPVA